MVNSMESFHKVTLRSPDTVFRISVALCVIHIVTGSVDLICPLRSKRNLNGRKNTRNGGQRALPVDKLHFASGIILIAALQYFNQGHCNCLAFRALL